MLASLCMPLCFANEEIPSNDKLDVALLIGGDTNPNRLTAKSPQGTSPLTEFPFAPSESFSLLTHAKTRWAIGTHHVWLDHKGSLLLSVGTAPGESSEWGERNGPRSAFLGLFSERIQNGWVHRWYLEDAPGDDDDLQEIALYLVADAFSTLLPGLEWEDERGHRIPLSSSRPGDSLWLSRGKLRGGASWQNRWLTIVSSWESTFETLFHVQQGHGVPQVQTVFQELRPSDEVNGFFSNVGHAHRLIGTASLHLTEMLPKLPFVEDIRLKSRLRGGFVDLFGQNGIPLSWIWGASLVAWDGRLLLDVSAGLFAMARVENVLWDVVVETKGSLAILDERLLLTLALTRTQVATPIATSVSVHELRLGSRFSFAGLSASGVAGFRTLLPQQVVEGFLPGATRTLPDGWIFSSAQVKLSTLEPLLLSVRVELRASDAFFPAGAREGDGLSYARFFLLLGTHFSPIL
ncbi:MAG: hypothetical protein GY822_04945 [Deltaproteobacteria bacterium]|nr:hypothetical protein [Deltaproteobacteria bacterium]